MRESKRIRKGLYGMLLIMSLVVFLLTGNVSADQWAMTYGGTGYDYAHSIQQTSDGGYIVAGGTYSFGIFSDDVWVLKLDGDGNVLWQKTYGRDVADYGNSIQQTLDGGYILAASTYFAGASDVLILKLDDSGNIQWQRTYGGNEYDWPKSVQQTSDGGYVVAGSSHSFGAGYDDAWILKLDGSGNVVWQKTYGGTLGDSANSVQQTSEGGYVIAGSTQSFAISYLDAWVLKLDGNGNVLWQKTYGGSSYDYAYSIRQTSDGGYVVAGGTESFGAVSSDAWILKLDGNGNVMWQKKYDQSNYEYAFSAQETSDGGYVMASITKADADPYDTWVSKLDGNGNVQWQKTYGGSSYDWLHSIQQTSDGGYIVAGETESFGAGGRDLWVSKLDGNGDIADCPITGTSNAAVSDTNAIINDTTVTGIDTSVSPQTSNAVSADTNAIVRDTCSSPTIGYSPTSFVFAATQGGSNPTDQILSISNTGGGTLNWSVSDDTAWLSLDPTSGTNSGNVTLSVNIAGLTAGMYNVTITITAAEATNSPVSIPVALIVNPMLILPNGGEVIPSGSTYTVTWNAPPDAVKFDIGYSLDDGVPGTWKLIASGLTDYSHNWTVPEPDGNKNTCRVGVRGYDAIDGIVGTDISDNPFTIEVVKLTYPNGGETLTSGETYQITWQTNGTIRPVQSVQIYGSPNEGQSGTWRLLTTVSGNPGYYDWTVPLVGTAKDKCRLGVRLLDSASIPIGHDIGDGNFTIQPAL